MPTGIIVLIIGIVVGAVLGWIFMGDPFAGGAAGFAIAVVTLGTHARYLPADSAAPPSRACALRVTAP